MRIRTIKPGFFKHELIADLAPLTRLLFVSLWCMADRRGRLEDRPRRIKVECLPFDDCDVDAMLWELHRAGFVDRYEVDGIELIQVVAFEKHQRVSGNESQTESEFPEKHSGSNLEAPEKHQGSQEGKGVKEGKGKEKGKERGARAAFLPPTLDEWQAYCIATWSDWHPSRSQESHEYYTGVNWRVGAAKKQAEDWRACARTAHTNAVKWGNLNPIMPAPSMAEWLEFAGAFAAQNAPFPTEPRFIWPEDLAKAAFSRHKAANWLRISDWRSQAKADCREWVGREISNRQRPNR